MHNVTSSDRHYFQIKLDSNSTSIWWKFGNVLWNLFDSKWESRGQFHSCSKFDSNSNSFFFYNRNNLVNFEHFYRLYLPTYSLKSKLRLIAQTTHLFIAYVFLRYTVLKNVFFLIKEDYLKIPWKIISITWFIYFSHFHA